jgi:molybdopterin molybdotransferase
MVMNMAAQHDYDSIPPVGSSHHIHQNSLALEDTQNTHTTFPSSMSLSYAAGLARVLDIAREQRGSRHESQHNAHLHDAVGGIAAGDIRSPKSIPEYDTSAMDGYAVRSQATANACPEKPVMFRVQGTVAAGDDPANALNGIGRGHGTMERNVNVCVEIMTGAIFPEGYDACVKVEDTVSVDAPERGQILITQPVARNANRRLTGSDIREGDIIIRQGEVVQPSHVLPLTSIGLGSIPVSRKPRVGIWSTGKEMVNGLGATRDTNGPYLTAAVKEMGIGVAFLGILDDDPTKLQRDVQETADRAEYDVLITSGAVSKGRFDHVRAVLGQMGAEIVFHGLAIRPGHPVLFALLPGTKGKTAFFGLPGNPGAAAACFRFLAVPYLRALQGQPTERPILARLLRQPTTSTPKHGCHSMQNTDCFRHGVLSTSPTGHLTVEPSPDQSPAKLGPFITANCWIHLRPADQATLPGPAGSHLVECYPISPTGAIHLSTALPN